MTQNVHSHEIPKKSIFLLRLNSGCEKITGKPKETSFGFKISLLPFYFLKLAIAL
jgi:hypothetical protein